MNLVSPFTVEPLQSATGFISPGFVVDSTGNIKSDGNIVLTSGTITNGTTTLVTTTGLGPNITSSNLTSVGTLSSLNVSGPVVISGNITSTGQISIKPSVTTGKIDNIDIGSLTPAIGIFTNITASNNVNFNNINTITINPSTTGNINNVIIGNTTPKSGTFTTLQSETANFTTSFSTLDANITNSISANSGIFTTSISAASATITSASFTSATLTNLTVSGMITQSTSPTLNTHVANKLYVDNVRASMIGISAALT